MVLGRVRIPPSRCNGKIPIRMPHVRKSPPPPAKRETRIKSAAVSPPQMRLAGTGLEGFSFPAIIPPTSAATAKAAADTGGIRAVGSGLLYRISAETVISRSAVKTVIPNVTG